MGRDYPLSATPAFDSIPKPMSRRDKKTEQMNASQEKLKKDYSNSTPKVEWQNKNKTQMLQKLSTDTFGLSSGKKEFTQKATLHGGRESYRKVSKGYVDRISKKKS
jgi:hypothetical protein